MNNQFRQPQKNELDHQGMLNYKDFELNKEIDLDLNNYFLKY